MNKIENIKLYIENKLKNIKEKFDFLYKLSSEKDKSYLKLIDEYQIYLNYINLVKNQENNIVLLKQYLENRLKKLEEKQNKSYYIRDFKEYNICLKLIDKIKIILNYI